VTRRAAQAFTVSVLLALVAAAGAVPAAAGATRTTATGTETCRPQSPGTTTVLPGGRVLVRDAGNVCQETSADPRLSGTNTTTFNANLGADGTGPMWGTFSLATAGGGLWVGTWHGRLTSAGPVYRAVGRGEGAHAGLLVFVEAEGERWTATILDPTGA
jgi:hypothetical protein